MAVLIKPQQTLLFVGDSITDCDHRGPFVPLGDGYPRMVSDLITVRYPAHRLQVINVGIDGDTVRNLANCWTDDVIRHRPNWMLIKIGINDLSQWLAQDPKDSVSPPQYAELYEHFCCPGSVRPHAAGHLVITHVWLKAMGW